jgi:hypothetical protein
MDSGANSLYQCTRLHGQMCVAHVLFSPHGPVVLYWLTDTVRQNAPSQRSYTPVPRLLWQAE